jgi:tellurite resistance protein TerC
VAVCAALGFGLWLLLEDGAPRASLFVTGYLLEEALSIDNLFVFLVLFSFFGCRARAQRRTLFWGILSALFLRALLIWTGTSLVDRFHWVLYLFGALLLWSAWRLLSGVEADVQPEKNRVLRLIRRLIPMTTEYDGSRFLTRVNGKLVATPLLAVLIVVETTDIVFALDSVPAIIGITTDKFLVYTSNVFAICALRSLYFALAAMMGRFRHLNVGLALVLAFVGIKLLAERPIERWLGAPLPVWVSLSVVAVCIGGAIAFSLLLPERGRLPPPSAESGAFEAAEKETK